MPFCIIVFIKISVHTGLQDFSINCFIQQFNDAVYFIVCDIINIMDCNLIGITATLLIKIMYAFRINRNYTTCHIIGQLSWGGNTIYNCMVNCKTKFHSQILKLEVNLSKKHWRLILPKKDYNSYHWFSTCCSGQNRRT